MIVVIGTPVAARRDRDLVLAGTPALAAAAAARAGGRVELVGRAGEDPDGDRLMLALARAGVGHAALVRVPSVATPVLAGDVDEADEDVKAREASALDDQRLATADEPGADGGPARLALEPADVELALDYLPDYGVVVLAELAGADVVDAVARRAAFAGARLIAVARGSDGLPADAIALEPPDRDPDGAFAEFLGAYAAALDAGADPRAALGDVTGRLGWERPLSD